MRIAFVYANSWEFAYPQFAGDIDRKIWCVTDDFIIKYPRAAQLAGMEPVLFYLSASARTPADFTHAYGFRLRRVPVRFGAGDLDREISLRLLRELARERFDLIHFYNYYRGRLLPDFFDLFAFHARLRGVPFVTHYQASEFPAANPARPWAGRMLYPRRLLKWAALRSAARIFSVNRVELERLSNPDHPGFYGFPIPRRHCVYLPNIVDAERFRPVPRAEACREAGVDPSRRYVLYTGYFRPAKGVRHLVRILPELARHEPRTTLLLVGQGPCEPELRALARAQGCEDRVRFAGLVLHDRLPAYYSLADVHVLPSYTEGLPSVVLEAMACGTPSVGTTVGGIPEALADGLGLLVPPGDEPALLAAVREVLDGRFVPDPERRRARLAEHSYESVASVLRREYVSVLEERRTPHV